MRYFACAMQLIALPRTALPLLDFYAPRCAFETLLSAVQLLCSAFAYQGHNMLCRCLTKQSLLRLPLPHKEIIAPSCFAVVVLHATRPRFANEVLCAAGPCYASEVFRATAPCSASEVLHATGPRYAIDEICCATPVQLTALLCVSMPMPRATWLCVTKALLLFAPPFQRFITRIYQCRCCVNLSHQCQCDADAVLI